LEIRRLWSGYGRLLNYYLKDDLDKVNAALPRLVPRPNVPDYVPIEDALEAIGGCLDTLYRRMRAKRVRPKKVVGKSTDTRARPRSYVPRWFVDEIKRVREADKKPADRMTVREAMARLGCSKSKIHSLIDRGVLKRYPVMLQCKGGRHRPGVLLSRAQVDRLAGEAPTPTTTPPEMNSHAAAPEAAAGRPAHPTRNKGGRPKGRIDPEVAKRNNKIRMAWDKREFGTNKAAYARAFGVDRKTIYEIVS
jgi:hypothetical protein